MAINTTFDFGQLQKALEFTVAPMRNKDDPEVRDDIDGEREAFPENDDDEVAVGQASTGALQIEQAVRNLSRGITEGTNKEYMR